MEPRPNHTAHGTGSSPAGSPPAGSNASANSLHPSDPARWSGSAWSSPSAPPPAAPSTPRQDPVFAKAADWRGQPGMYAPGSDNGYSPGPSLAPIDQRRGSSWLGPLVALVVLAVIVVAVAVAFNKVRGGGDNRHGSSPPQAAGLAAPALTATAQAGLQTQITATSASAAVSPTAQATAAVKPTKAAEPTQAPEPTKTAASSSSSGAAALLPTVNEVGGGYVVTEDGTRTRDDVAASFGDPADALAKLKSWNWKENAYRTFEIPAAQQTDPNATTYITVSIHRFAGPNGTSAALTYFADAVVSAQGMTDVKVETIGNQTRELTSSSSEANLVVLYIRKGNYLIRLGASSPTGDPSADLIALAKKIVG